MARRRHVIPLGIAGFLAIVVGGPLVLIRSLTFDPPPEMPVATEVAGEATSWGGDPLRVLVWNIQFCASRKHQFFYDGGDAVHVPPVDVDETVAAIAAVISTHDPDVVLLQEVDRDSARTGRVDQLTAIRRAVPYPMWLSTPYHRVRYLPYPSGQHLGRVDMHLATLSRHTLRGGRRQQLALLDEPWFRRAFNLKRAVLEARMSCHPVGEIALLNTHLSAFSRGDGTLPRQVEQLQQTLDQLDGEGVPWILAGDFNMLPPGDDPERLTMDSSLYGDTHNPIEILFDAGRRSALSLGTPFPGTVGTYLPFGETLPDRTLDYVFVSEGLKVLSATVLASYNEISDHLPLLVEVQLP